MAAGKLKGQAIQATEADLVEYAIPFNDDMARLTVDFTGEQKDSHGLPPFKRTGGDLISGSNPRKTSLSSSDGERNRADRLAAGDLTISCNQPTCVLLERN